MTSASLRNPSPEKTPNIQAKAWTPLNNAGLNRLAACLQTPVLVLTDSSAPPATRTLARQLAAGLVLRGVTAEYAELHAQPLILRGQRNYALAELNKQFARYTVVIFSAGTRITGARRLWAHLRKLPRLVWLDPQPAQMAEAGIRPPADAGLLKEPECQAVAVPNYGLALQKEVDVSWSRRTTASLPTSAQNVDDSAPAVARTLGDALPWAQACAMWPPPLPVTVAEAVRENCYPHLPGEGMARLFAFSPLWKRGDRGDFQNTGVENPPQPPFSKGGGSAGSLHFPPRLLALLRSGIATQDLPRQEQELHFLRDWLLKHKPPAADAVAGIEWHWSLARLELELWPDKALPRLRWLAGEAETSLRVHSEMAGVVLPAKPGAGSGERIPLRLKPRTRRGLRHLHALAPECGVTYAEIHPLRYGLRYGYDCCHHLLHKPALLGIFTPDGKGILSVDADNRARLWYPDQGEERLFFAGGDFAPPGFGHRWRPGKPVALFYPDGKQLVTVDNCVRIWDTDSGAPVYVLKTHGLSLRGLCLDEDEQLLALSSHGQVWNLTRNRLLLRLHGHRRMPNSLAVDGSRLLSAANDSTARLWDRHTGETLHVLRGHRGAVNQARFSPNGRRIVTAGADGSACLWDSAGGHALRRLQGHRKSVTDACFSPDGRWILTASADGTARLWEGDQCVQVLDGRRSGLTGAVFSPDGQRILTTANDGVLKVWALKT